MKSREWFYAAKQRTLKQCDAALGEIRKEVKEVEVKIYRATIPPRAQGDVAGAIMASEVRAWLRAASESERLSLS